METNSLKALALAVLAGNLEGNSQETKSFPRGKQVGNSSSKSFPVEIARLVNHETSSDKSRCECDNCKKAENIPSIGNGCVYKAKGPYPDIWTHIDALDECPRGYWN